MHRSLRFGLFTLAISTATAQDPTSRVQVRSRAVVLHFQVIAALNTPARDLAIADVDSVLHRLFRFAGYRLVASGSATVMENTQFSVPMTSTDGDRFEAVGTASELTGVCDGPRLPIKLQGFAARTPGPLFVIDGVVQPSPAGTQVPLRVELIRRPGETATATSLLSTGISLEIGHTVVLGSAEPAGSGAPLILTVRPELASPVCRPGEGKELAEADIESVEVIRGPSAAALYGENGGKGVIVVTTKHGSSAAPVATPAAPAAPAGGAKPSDVASPDAIIAALYDVISGPAGQKRDWDRFRSLFAPGARLIPTSVGPDKRVAIRAMTPDEYAASAGPNFERTGFFEREVSRRSEPAGSIMHAFSAYESRRSPSDKTPFARGTNSIQLLNDGTRWWIVTVYWASER
jgi:TonB-dependent SusC/RagA subfamily outer membrane receptor